MPKSISARKLNEDRETLAGLKALDDYAPSNPAHEVKALSAVDQEIFAVHDERMRVWQQYETLYAREASLVRQFHSGITGARRSVVAQYDSDSPALEAVGLTRASDRKKPKRRVEG